MALIKYDEKTESKQCVRCGLVDYTSNIYCLRCQGELKKEAIERKERKKRRRVRASDRQKGKDRRFGKLFRW